VNTGLGHRLVALPETYDELVAVVRSTLF